MIAVRAIGAAALVACGVLAASQARADPQAATKAQCAKTNADAQALRMEGKLAAARAQLEMCQAAACPAIVREDCTQRLDELERAQPTVVFDVKDAAGGDVNVTSVTIDGMPLSGRLAGALRVDPGGHTYTLTLSGQPPVTRSFAIKEAEKDRREVIVLGPVAPAPPPAPPPGQGLGARKELGLVAGGVGIASVVVGSIFGALTFSAVSQQKIDCASATDCKNPALAASDHSRVGTDGAISTATFIAGGALIGAGALLFFTAPPSSPTSRESTGLRIVPGAGPEGGGLTLLGRF